MFTERNNKFDSYENDDSDAPKPRTKRKRKSFSKRIDREDERMIFQGTVEESLPGTLFHVKINNDMLVLATLSGKLRQNHIQILLGDNVTIEVSPYDTTRGRIIRRN